ncbi:hypothetical protein LAJ19_14010 (plasmid) [Deinococcus taeanensis]|uniref:hypothetical protein n=1 Tax=Deinococcus taeanensis TaxID=2737050 RepID=UPI001CDB557D|nr:hypothetical protein [Deinococcus taeanensis]UBV44283.1 hypothetical protein LAJ19_14010 [Deinococcus taeanensis]
MRPRHAVTYLALITRTALGYAGLIPDLTVLATAATRDEVAGALAQGLALHLLDSAAPAPRPWATGLADLPGDLQAAYAGREVEQLLVSPAALNPVSLQVARAVAASGLSYREVARRAGMDPAALARMTDPFFQAHTMVALQQLAGVLRLALDVAFVSPVDLPPGAVVGAAWRGALTPLLRVRDVPEVLDADLPLTVRSDRGAFQLLRPAAAQPESSGSTVYEVRELSSARRAGRELKAPAPGLAAAGGGQAF